MNYSLPEALTVGGAEHKIRTDYRVILDAIAALNDKELEPSERAEACVRIIFPDWRNIENHFEAYEQCLWFIACGEDIKNERKRPKIMDWEQDFGLIVPPINRVLGYDCRGSAPLHWWSFVAAYYEIGECAFSCVTGIRRKLQTGKPLDNWEKEYYRDNHEAITLKSRLTAEEQAEIDDILGGE